MTGSNSGLGQDITVSLLEQGWTVYGCGLTDNPGDADAAIPEEGGNDYIYHQVDLRWEEEINRFVSKMPEKVDLLINCAGVNLLKPIPDLKGGDWEVVMDTNAKSMWMMTRALIERMENQAAPLEAGTVINIVSNAARIPMTHSLAYNASKGAALMVSKQMARELFPSHGICVFSISPNKLYGTNMSREIEERVPALRGWTAEEAAEYQAKALPTGIETEPEVLADFIAYLVSDKRRNIFLHTCDIPYGG